MLAAAKEASNTGIVYHSHSHYDYPDSRLTLACQYSISNYICRHHACHKDIVSHKVVSGEHMSSVLLVSLRSTTANLDVVAASVAARHSGEKGCLEV